MSSLLRRAGSTSKAKSAAFSRGVLCHALLMTTPFIDPSNNNGLLELLDLSHYGVSRTVAELIS